MISARGSVAIKAPLKHLETSELEKLKTSESVKTSPCIELTSEQEGEQDLVLRGRGGKGGGLVGNVLGLGVKMD